jgi:hypothetical protein
MKRTQLLLGHLENISWRVLQAYPELLREFMRRRYGVYALYRKGRLYYVGLASDLRNRLKSHLRDRHHGAWDRFSVYLTLRSDQIKDLESLLLRIIGPEGNRTGGKFAGSEDLFPALGRRVRDIDADRRAAILGGLVADRRRRARARRAKGQEALIGFAERRVSLRGRYKGKTFKATLRRDGKIRLRGKLYTSPSAAAHSIVDRSVDGWHFWRFKDERGDWVQLATVRR